MSLTHPYDVFGSANAILAAVGRRPCCSACSVHRFPVPARAAGGGAAGGLAGPQTAQQPPQRGSATLEDSSAGCGRGHGAGAAAGYRRAGAGARAAVGGAVALRVHQVCTRTVSCFFRGVKSGV